MTRLERKAEELMQSRRGIRLDTWEEAERRVAKLKYRRPCMIWKAVRFNRKGKGKTGFRDGTQVIGGGMISFGHKHFGLLYKAVAEAWFLYKEGILNEAEFPKPVQEDTKLLMIMMTLGKKVRREIRRRTISIDTY